MPGHHVKLVVEDEHDVVARHHLMYNSGNAEQFHHWVIMSIEKNRSGADSIDIEFRKRFEHSRFDTDGGRVQEDLVDDRVFVE